MIRLLIADDHTIVRDGLKQLFSLVDDITVVGEAVNGGEVLERLREGGIDLVLLDMTMPGISGVDLISRIHAHDERQPILVLSMHNELQVVRRALKAGASGYLTKDADSKTLLAAIRKVAAGKRFIGPELAELLAFDAPSAGQGQPHEKLSDREFEILRLLAKGQSVNEVADALAISNKTVSTHKARLMQKMGFASNADLVRYAVAHRLTD